MDYNCLESIPSATFSKVEQLTIVSLSNNNIHQMFDVGELENLRVSTKCFIRLFERVFQTHFGQGILVFCTPKTLGCSDHLT